MGGAKFAYIQIILKFRSCTSMKELDRKARADSSLPVIPVHPERAIPPQEVEAWDST